MASREAVDNKIERHENIVIATVTLHHRYTDGPPTEIIQMRVYQQRAAGWMLVSHRSIREIHFK